MHLIYFVIKLAILIFLIFSSLINSGFPTFNFVFPVKTVQMLVCNYGPGGNMLDDKVYTVGKVGADCKNGVNDGLCKQ